MGGRVRSRGARPGFGIDAVDLNEPLVSRPGATTALPAIAIALFLASVLPALAATAPVSPAWQQVAPGLELNSFPSGIPNSVGDGLITVLRIDPALWALECVDVNRTGERDGRTARQWCEAYGLTAAINFGMYAADGRSHVGYLEWRGHVSSKRVNGYPSVAAFDPRQGSGRPAFRIFDLDDPHTTVPEILEDYASVVQNLRLIKRPGENRWKPQPKRWSEAALAEDAQGRILFVFSRSPYTMFEFNDALLALGLEVVAAQHLEGGPAAQLHLHAGAYELDLVGSFETGVLEGLDNRMAWPIPGVLGLRRR